MHYLSSARKKYGFFFTFSTGLLLLLKILLSKFELQQFSLIHSTLPLFLLHTWANKVLIIPENENSSQAIDVNNIFFVEKKIRSYNFILANNLIKKDSREKD